MLTMLLLHVASFKQNHQLAGVAKLFSIVLQEGEDPKLSSYAGSCATHATLNCTSMGNNFLIFVQIQTIHTKDNLRILNTTSNQ